MSSVPSIAMSGMTAAMRSVEASARRVAHGSTAAAPDAGGTGIASDVNFADEAVIQMFARYDFASNAVVLRTHSQMMKSLFDIKA